LSYADGKSENMTDRPNQQLRHLYTRYRYLPIQITLENFNLCKYTIASSLTSPRTKTNGK